MPSIWILMGAHLRIQFSSRNIIIVGWALAVVLGMAALHRYELTAAPKSAVAATWPDAAASPGKIDRPTLIMALHPQCPCSRASLAELAQLLDHAKGGCLLRILVIAPRGEDIDWVQSDTWKQATQIPDADVIIDRDGQEAAAFGATTSGQILLYSAEGKLLFSGGITDGRGHQGDNAGYDALLAILHHGVPATRSSPVFGCALPAATRHASGGM